MMTTVVPAVDHTCFDLRRYPDITQQHVHAHHQVILPLAGQLTVQVGDNTAAASDHTAAVIASNLPHSFTGSSDNTFLVLDIPTDAVAAINAPASVWQAFSQAPFVTFDASLTDLCRFIASNRPQLGGNRLRTDVLGNLVIELLGHAIGLDEQDIPARLRKAQGFIDGHYRQPIAVADIARAANLSESRLYALFERWIGVSPARYVARRRLQDAAFRLRRTQLPIVEIALGAGYGDQSAFTRAFQREFEQSPSAYRKSATLQ